MLNAWLWKFKTTATIVQRNGSKYRKNNNYNDGQFEMWLPLTSKDKYTFAQYLRACIMCQIPWYFFVTEKFFFFFFWKKGSHFCHIRVCYGSAANKYFLGHALNVCQILYLYNKDTIHAPICCTTTKIKLDTCH